MSSIPGSLSSFRLVRPSPSPARVVGRARLAAPSHCRRGISQSAASQKAIPFSLNATRSESVASGREEGKVLRMIMFGAFALITQILGVGGHDVVCAPV